MRKTISDALVRSIPPPKPGERVEVWDQHTRNLCLRITSNGVASWTVRARLKDGTKQSRIRLGSWPAMTVKQARVAALGALSAVQAGGDPVGERRAQEAAQTARAALPSVAQRLQQWQAAKAREWSPRYARDVGKLVAAEIPPSLARKPLIETSRTDWTSVAAAKRKTAPAQASLIYRVCASFLGYAEAAGWAPALLPRKGLKTIAPIAAPRERALTDAELMALWNATKALSPKTKCFTRLLILTACRELEAADIAVGEVNLTTARWTLSGNRTKNNRPITLPLNSTLIDDLRAVWPEHAAEPTWRLLGQIKGSGLRGFSKLKRSLDEKSGVSGWRFHDLRRTARTTLTRLGVPKDHAEAALNHVSGRSTLERVYDRHDYAEEIIAAVSRWQAHVIALVSEQASAEIVSIRRSA